MFSVCMINFPPQFYIPLSKNKDQYETLKEAILKRYPNLKNKIEKLKFSKKLTKEQFIDVINTILGLRNGFFFTDNKLPGITITGKNNVEIYSSTSSIITPVKELPLSVDSLTKEGEKIILFRPLFFKILDNERGKLLERVIDEKITDDFFTFLGLIRRLINNSANDLTLDNYYSLYEIYVEYTPLKAYAVVKGFDNGMEFFDNDKLDIYYNPFQMYPFIFFINKELSVNEAKVLLDFMNLLTSTSRIDKLINELGFTDRMVSQLNIKPLKNKKLIEESKNG